MSDTEITDDDLKLTPAEVYTANKTFTRRATEELRQEYFASGGTAPGYPPPKEAVKKRCYVMYCAAKKKYGK